MQVTPLYGVWGSAPENFVFGPYIRMDIPTYGFVHDFTHGFGCDGFRSMVLDVIVFGPWYWMLRHVYICIVTLKVYNENSSW